MEIAVESIKMAPGAIPRPGRVPEQRLLSPEIGLRRRRRCRTLYEKTPIDLGFSRRRDYIGGRAMLGGGPGGHTTWWRGQRGGGAPYGVPICWPPPSPLWTPCRVRKNRNFMLCFVQFREYFVCNFSETQKQQKTGTDTVASR
jgi:hypothetical protein